MITAAGKAETLVIVLKQARNAIQIVLAAKDAGSSNFNEKFPKIPKISKNSKKRNGKFQNSKM